MKGAEGVDETASARPAPLVRKRFWQNDMEAVLGIMAVLLILGTVNVASSSFVTAEMRFDDPYFFLKRHAIATVVGVVCCLVFARVDYHVWRKYMPLVFFATLFALIYVYLFGAVVNGAKRWLALPFMQMQPAEGAKIVTIMIAAASLAKNKHGGRRVGLLGLVNPQYLAIIVLAGLVLIEPDMATAAVVAGVPVILFFFVASLSKTKILGFAGVLGAIIAVLIHFQPYRLKRVLTVWDPWSDAQGVGYQTVQSILTVGSGRLTGMGLGVGYSKYAYLPEGHTDFAFAIFSQENGFLGVFFVCFLLAALAVYGVRIAHKASDIYGQLLAFGIVILIVGQGLCNIAMVGGSFPVVGVPLPFISYGGSSLIFTMIAIGILINIGRVGERAERMREQAHYEEELRETAPKPHIGLRLVKK